MLTLIIVIEENPHEGQIWTQNGEVKISAGGSTACQALYLWIFDIANSP